MSAARVLFDRAVETGMVSRPLMDSVRRHEGYRGTVYKDTLGKDTIGVGCLLPLSEDEAMLLAACRAADTRGELVAMLEGKGVVWSALSPALRDALTEAAFQLGVPRLARFEKMLAAIREGRWEDAAREATASRWNAQTPVRAQALAGVLRAQGAG